MQHPGRTRIGLAILFHLLEARQADHGSVGPDARPFVGGVKIVGAKLGPARRHLALEEGDAADVVEVRHQRRRPLQEQGRSEEHTSELQSLTNLVCRLLLEKKKYK